MQKRLYRNESDSVLGGVCGGLGQYLGVDPIFIRIFFVLWTVLGELSIVIYMVLWLVVPRQSDASTFRPEDIGVRFRRIGAEIGDIAHEPSTKLIVYSGVGLIVWGVYYLLRRLDIFWFSWEYTWYLWPALLILAGTLVLFKTFLKKK